MVYFQTRCLTMPYIYCKPLLSQWIAKTRRDPDYFNVSVYYTRQFVVPTSAKGLGKFVSYIEGDLGLL